MRRLVLLLLIALPAALPPAAGAAHRDIQLPLSVDSDWEISPDGHWIATVVGTAQPDPRHDPFYRFDFYATPVDGGATRPLGSVAATSFEWRWLARSEGLALQLRGAAPHPDQQIVRVPIDGAGPVALTPPLDDTCPGGCALRTLGSTPDGAIVYMRAEAGSWRLFRAGPRGGPAPTELAVLADLPAPAVVACALAAGSLVICQHGDTIVRVAAAGPAHVDILYQSGGALLGGPLFSRDGTAALLFDQASGGAAVDLYALRFDGAGPAVRLASYPAPTAGAIGALITPDGRIAIFPQTSGSSDLLAVPTDGSAPPLPVGGQALLAPLQPGETPQDLADRYFTRDSRWLIFQGSCRGTGGGVVSGICRYDLRAPLEQATLLVTPGPPGATLLGSTIAAGGRYLGYITYAQAGQAMRVYTIAIAGQPGSEVLQTDSPPEGAGTNRWGTIGGSFIIHGVTSLMLVQAGGPPQTIDQWSLDGESLWRERYTGDGRYIYQIRAATPRAGLVDAGRLEGGFTLPALCASEPGGVAVVPVSLDTAPVDTRVLTYTIAGGTAGPSDIALPASGALVFGPGQRQALLDIPVVADGLAEPPETLLLSLAADPASVEVTRASLTLSILDEGTCQARMPLVVRP